MAVTSTYSSQLDVAETVAAVSPDASNVNSSVLHNGFDFLEVLNAGSTPPASKYAGFQAALVAGAATIDLTALTGSFGAAVTFAGLKVQHARFQNPSTNANSITVKFGAANPYNLLGASWQIILAPGQEVLLRLNNAAPVVGAGAKNIDLAGTGTQALNVQLVAG